MEISVVDKTKFAESLKPAYADFSKRFGKETLDAIANVK